MRSEIFIGCEILGKFRIFFRGLKTLLWDLPLILLEMKPAQPREAALAFFWQPLNLRNAEGFRHPSGACLFGGDWMYRNGAERGLQLFDLTPWNCGRGKKAGGNSCGSGGDDGMGFDHPTVDG